MKRVSIKYEGKQYDATAEKEGDTIYYILSRNGRIVMDCDVDKVEKKDNNRSQPGAP